MMGNQLMLSNICNIILLLWLVHNLRYLHNKKNVSDRCLKAQVIANALVYLNLGIVLTNAVYDF